MASMALFNSAYKAPEAKPNINNIKSQGKKRDSGEEGEDMGTSVILLY